MNNKNENDVIVNSQLPQPKPAKKRALALDALRGFAILTMILSGVVPWSSLPGWMYHAQTPPPTRVFNPNIPGITWVDLVFPFFLFSMGAAIPIAISNRLKRGENYLKILFYIFERGFLLVVFAIFRQHVVTLSIRENPTILTHIEALLAFVILFGMYMRFPDGWNKNLKVVLRLSGWVGMIILLYVVRMPDGSGFKINRSDIIIMVLANMAVFGSLIWLISQKSILLRLTFFGIYLAIRLSSAAEGDSWVKWIYNFPSNNYGIYSMGFLKYLFIIIPGSIIGDTLLNWINNSGKTNEKDTNWSKKRLWGISVLMILFIIVELIGLYARLIWQTTFISFIMCLLGWYLMSKPTTETEKFLKNIYMWGVYWLVLGLFFEPFEGGIKKDPSTMSYYFVTTGLAIFLMIAFTIIIDIFNIKRGLNFLIENGQNPMIAYVGYSNCICPLLMLTMLNSVIEPILSTPWLGFVYAVIKTSLLAVLVSFFTKRKIFWRT